MSIRREFAGEYLATNTTSQQGRCKFFWARVRETIAQVATWINEAKTVHRMGMPVDSFSLVLHGPSKHASQQLGDAVIQAAIWQDGAVEIARREGGRFLYYKDAIAEDFVEVIKEMLHGDIPARFDADMGEVWNIDEILRERNGEWPDAVTELFILDKFDPPDGGWEAAFAGYVEKVDWADRMDGWDRMVRED